MLLRARFLFALALPLMACGSKAPSKPKVEKQADAAATSAATADKSKTAPEPPDPAMLPPPPDVAAAPADAEKTKSGLASKVLTPGKGGDHPRAWDEVEVNYTGWTTDGKMFDSSLVERFPGQKPEPVKFPLNRVVPGWTEGVQLMTAGEKRRFWIPEDLAYKGQMGAPQGTLVFDVELVAFKKMPDPPPVPSDVAEPPKGAQKTSTGLFSKVLTKGKPGKKPVATDIVKAHYTGWTTDGQMFDSSVTRGEPATFALAQVIPGWSEGVQLMTAGEKRRFWIPKELAYNDRPGRPQGMLVFDIELVDVVTPKTPPDVAAAPADAQNGPEGIKFKVLQKGTGTEHPTPASSVKVHYSGWTTDGKLFDSSYSRGQPAEFSLYGVIPGWTLSVPLLVKGERRRFWIPAKLAYEGQEGPQGMLVFDIELIDFQNPPPMPEEDAGAVETVEVPEYDAAVKVDEKGNILPDDADKSKK